MDEGASYFLIVRKDPNNQCVGSILQLDTQKSTEFLGLEHLQEIFESLLEKEKKKRLNNNTF